MDKDIETTTFIDKNMTTSILGCTYHSSGDPTRTLYIPLYIPMLLCVHLHIHIYIYICICTLVYVYIYIYVCLSLCRR